MTRNAEQKRDALISSPFRLHSLTWVAVGLAALAGLLHLGLLFYIFFNRMSYPLDLEWMESGMLCHALRIMEGRPLYAPPSVEFISFLYTPFYPFVLASLGKVFGLSYLLGRLISVVSFSLVLTFIFLAVRRQNSSSRQGVLWGIVALGLLASSFPFTCAWYDLVRNDSLFLALMTGCLYLLRYYHQRLGLLILAGVLAGLAFLTKQTAAMFIVFSGGALLILNWRRLPLYVAVVGLVAGGSTLLLNKLTSGWFWRYVFEFHQGHDLYWERIWPQTELKLLGFFPAVAGVIGLWLLLSLIQWAVKRRIPREHWGLLYWFFLAVVGVVVSAVGFATQWAEKNAYIPGLVYGGMFAAMAAGDLASRYGGRGRLAFVSVALAFIAGGALTTQLLHQLYDPRPHIPNARDRQTGAKLLQLVRSFPGEVLMPYHPFYPVLVGKRPSYPQMGINDVTRAGLPFPKDIIERVQNTFYDAIILDNPPHERYGFVFNTYKLARIFSRGEMPKVVTGYRVSPTYLFVPKRKAAPPKGAKRVFDFEDGSYHGWEVWGEAFGRKPATSTPWSRLLVGNFEGEYFASSDASGDRGIGSMLSEEFDVDRKFLSFRIGGAYRPGKLEVKLLVEGKEVHQDSGPGTDIMEERSVDVSSYRGKKMRILLVDRDRQPSGHILFDDVMLKD